MLSPINKKIRQGFSLVEVLIFVAIVSVFFTVAASVSTYMIRNATTNQRKIIALRYAEELVEWLRIEKEISWGTFSDNSDPFGNNPICFNSLDWTGNCGLIDNLYTREVYLKGISTGSLVHQVDVKVEVSWTEAGRTYWVPLNTVFSIWEQ